MIFEYWKNVPNYPGYQVSSLGNARTIDRKIVDSRGAVRKLKGQSLRLMDRANGYVCIRMSIASKIDKVNMHRMIYSLFIGPLITGLIIMHRNNDKTNNSVLNLYQGTYHENRIHYLYGVL